MGVPQNGWLIMENPYVGVPIINHYLGVHIIRIIWGTPRVRKAPYVGVHIMWPFF